jgi:hypothetical protein
MFFGPSRKEAGTRIYITEIRIDLAKQVFQLHGGDTRSKRCSASNRSQMYHSVSMGPPDTGRSCTSALGGEFNWSLQQMPEISLLVFRILRFFLGVRSTAEPPY